MSLPLMRAPRCQLPQTFALEAQISSQIKNCDRLSEFLNVFCATLLPRSGWEPQAALFWPSASAGHDCARCLGLREADAVRAGRGELCDEKHDPSGVELYGAHSRNACGHRHHE